MEWNRLWHALHSNGCMLPCTSCLPSRSRWLRLLPCTSLPRQKAASSAAQLVEPSLGTRRPHVALEH